MPFEPKAFSSGCGAYLYENDSKNDWQPLYRQECTFGPEVFVECMMNMIKNPNLNSSWLFRADVLYDDGGDCQEQSVCQTKDHAANPVPRTRHLRGLNRDRTLIRRLIPRNDRRDRPLDQTCEIHSSSEFDGRPLWTVLLYIPHVDNAEEVPFYHPKVQGIAHLHEWNQTTRCGFVSIHYLPFPQSDVYEKKLQKIAFHLLELLCKHGQTAVEGGYTKRVHHDVIIPQSRLQDRYTSLKNKYAKGLIDSWAEVTDPSKHVFEDLAIASFLIEVWADMYNGRPFPGFVDIGCGNGLLVFLLNQEGYKGWGFDARRRKSWTHYNSASSMSPGGSALEERLLLPRIAVKDVEGIGQQQVHYGEFPPDTFIVSNHADELTPWTPILATISQCPFLMIPCCSHNLAGEKHRPPPPRDKTKPKSSFASLVDWVTQIGEACGWTVEVEMLRIPSTRNTGLLGRSRSQNYQAVNIEAVVDRFGGVQNYYTNVAKLLKAAPRCH